MMKKYKKTLIITSILILVPMLVGLILWNRLPDTIATHFGSDNEPNGWSSKFTVVFGMPLIMLALHWICLAATMNDPKKKNISGKMFRIILWVVPVVTILTLSLTYLNALGIRVDIGMFVNLLMGVLFIIIGNYLPKCKQNYTAGFRIPWTLSSEENWNKTHRLAGWLCLIGGILFLLNAFWLSEGMLIVIMGLVFIPVIYSFVLYKKGV